MPNHRNEFAVAVCLDSQDAETVLLIVVGDAIYDARQHFLGRLCRLRLSMAQDGDLELAGEFLSLLAANQADFTVAFRRLSETAIDVGLQTPLRSLFQDEQAFDSWAAQWRARLATEPGPLEICRTRMLSSNPAFIPRNHRIEAMIQAAVERGDFGPFEELLAVLANPFQDQPSFAQYMDPPRVHERVCQTFCGT